MWNLCLLILSLFVLTNCSLRPPDVEVCAPLSNGGSFCEHTLSNQKRFASSSEVSSPDRVSLTIEDFGKVKVFILEACERDVRCSIPERGE